MVRELGSNGAVSRPNIWEPKARKLLFPDDDIEVGWIHDGSES